MANVGAVISSIRNIMRQDRGISGDAQRLEQLGWMLFLKIMDDKDQELEITKDDYVSVIPEKFQWRSWATDTEGITGDELLAFIDSNSQDNKGLFATLRDLTSITNPKRAAIVKEVFEGSNNYMKSGYEMRKVINKLNEVDFNNSEDKHIFGDIYESILVELRDAGNKGEYYTPRAVTQLMTQMLDPKLGEKVLDPAAGTGGFLTAAIDHVRENYVHTVDDEHQLQKSITGWEFKPVAYVLGLTNLILHEMDIPDYHYMDSLKKEYNSIGAKDRVDVILANPPFGASIADGVETNFPATYRCKESADLFVILMLQLLKPKGRWAIVLPDGSITGDGVKARIREKLLNDCNLHTIIRLPQSTFFPAKVSTNLLFFEKGSKTKDIWYYEHNLPVGQKSYSKNKPIQFSEFQPIIDWWKDRKENDQAWKVNVSDLKDWDLDIKNPIKLKPKYVDPKEQIKSFRANEIRFDNILSEIINEVGIIENDTLSDIAKNHKYLFKNKGVVKQLKESILQTAIKGKLTETWRAQNPNTESANELLKRIKTEKDQLIKDKKIKKEKAFPKIIGEEIPFKLPDSWAWCRIQDTSSLKSGNSYKYLVGSEKDIPYVKVGDMNILGNFNDVLKSSNYFVYQDSMEKDLINPKSIIFPKRGGAIATNKRCNVLSKKILIDSNSMAINPSELINFDFFSWWFKTIDLSKFGNEAVVPQVNNKDILPIPFPLPPLDEQEAIVKNLESVMEKCQALEEEIKTSEANAQMLMQAVLKEAFLPAESIEQAGEGKKAMKLNPKDSNVYRK